MESAASIIATFASTHNLSHEQQVDLLCRFIGYLEFWDSSDGETAEEGLSRWLGNLVGWQEALPDVLTRATPHGDRGP